VQTGADFIVEEKVTVGVVKARRAKACFGRTASALHAERSCIIGTVVHSQRAGRHEMKVMSIENRKMSVTKCSRFSGAKGRSAH